jgi:hypothetical protein
MISLQGKPTDTILCELVTKGKRQPVFYVDELDKQRLNVVDTKELLGGHIEALQNQLKVGKEDIHTAIELLHGEQEPNDTHHSRVHKAFWKSKKLRESLLTSEMDIRDQKGQHFEINFPKQIEVFFGRSLDLRGAGKATGFAI